MNRILVSLAFAVLAVGCGGDDDDVGWEGTLVGGACASSEECEVQSERGDDYPDGTCTLPCNSDEDCRGGTSCIDREDGICLLACETPDDCPGRYECEGEENRGHGG